MDCFGKARWDGMGWDLYGRAGLSPSFYFTRFLTCGRGRVGW